MRVLLVSRGFPPRGRWGTEFYTHQLAIGLRARGHEIAVLHALRDPARARGEIDEAESDGFPVFTVHNPPDPRKPLADSYANARVEEAFDRLCDRWKPELAHFNYLLWGLSARLPQVAARRGLARVLTLTDFGLLCHRGQMFDWRSTDCRGPHPARVCARCIREPSEFDGKPGRVFAKRWASRAVALAGGLSRVVTRRDVELREAAIRETLAAVDHFIAPTHGLAEIFVRFGVERSRITELVYSFDETPFLAARAEPDAALVRIGFLGQYAPHKGPHVLLEAARIMAHRLPESVEPWEVVLHGDSSGDRFKGYVERAMSAGEPWRVSVRGPLPHTEVPAFFSSVHAIVVPSLWAENAPFAALQARAAGVPVLASDVPGLSQVIEPGVHGALFPPGDARALADLLREVVLRRVPRSTSRGLPMPYEEHVRAVEEVYARVTVHARTART